MIYTRDTFTIDREGKPTFLFTLDYEDGTPLAEVIRHSSYILNHVYGKSHSMSIQNEAGSVVAVLKSHSTREEVL